MDFGIHRGSWNLSLMDIKGKVLGESQVICRFLTVGIGIGTPSPLRCSTRRLLNSSSLAQF